MILSIFIVKPMRFLKIIIFINLFFKKLFSDLAPLPGLRMLCQPTGLGRPPAGRPAGLGPYELKKKQ